MKRAVPRPGTSQGEDTDGSAGIPIGAQVLSFLCGALVAFLGLKSARQDYRYIDKLKHLERFVETPGRFRYVKIRPDSLGSSHDFYPDVGYEYWVNGRNIWGWRLSYEEKPQSKAYWEARLAAYADSAAVPVYYNPAEPKDSILEKKHEGLYQTWLRLGLGALFCLAGLVLFVLPAWSWLKAGLRRKP